MTGNHGPTKAYLGGFLGICGYELSHTGVSMIVALVPRRSLLMDGGL